MKQVILSQKKTLLFVFLSLGIMTSYQNCSGAKSGATGDESTGATSTELASQDPLKPAAVNQKTASSQLNDATITGRLYTLESLQEGSQTLHLSSGAFTLQFSADSSALESGADQAPTMKNVTFVAVNACASKISGSGQMARFNGLPLPVGALALTVTDDVSNTGCTLALSNDDADLQNRNLLLGLLTNARTLVLVDDKVYLQTADGQTGVFAPTNSIGIVTDDLGTLLSGIQGSWDLQQLLIPICKNPAPGMVCAQGIRVTPFDPAYAMTIDVQGHVTLATPCGAITGQLRARTQPIAGVDGLQLQMAFPVLNSVSCSADDQQKVSALFSEFQNVQTIKNPASDGGMIWGTTSGDSLSFASE